MHELGKALFHVEHSAFLKLDESTLPPLLHWGVGSF